MGTGCGHRLRGQYQTASDGGFSIQNVPLGTYIVETNKEADGYPNTAMAFYSNLKIPTVAVSSILLNQNVTIVLAKGGGLDASDVVDAVTGSPIAAAVKLRRTDSGYWVLTSSTVKNILVPAFTAVAIEVSRSGLHDLVLPGIDRRFEKRNHQPSARARNGDFDSSADSFAGLGYVHP